MEVSGGVERGVVQKVRLYLVRGEGARFQPRGAVVLQHDARAGLREHIAVLHPRHCGGRCEAGSRPSTRCLRSIPSARKLRPLRPLTQTEKLNCFPTSPALESFSYRRGALTIMTEMSSHLFSSCCHTALAF